MNKFELFLKPFSLSVARFGLEKARCDVMENTMFRVCVVLKPPPNPEGCPVEFQFSLHLAVTGGKQTLYRL